MKNKLTIFYFPADEVLARQIARNCSAEIGEIDFHYFPDQEVLLTIQPDQLNNHEVILVASLNQPNEKLLSLLFFVKTVKDFGAQRVGLIAPYLAYMRQDKRFETGQVINAKCFAEVLSEHFDWLITIDPHLHRYETLDEIYAIPTHVLSATNIISDWIHENVNNPLLIGPDEESAQWVSRVAKKYQLPYVVLRKTRQSDEQVEISTPELAGYHNYTPVLVDDIISTAGTMIKTIEHLERANMPKVVCIGVHAVFAKNAYQKLQQAYVSRIITCNTIRHVSNGIDVSPVIVEAVIRLRSSSYAGQA